MLIYPLLCEIKAVFVKYIHDTENNNGSAIREECLIPTTIIWTSKEILTL